MTKSETWAQVVTRFPGNLTHPLSVVVNPHKVLLIIVLDNAGECNLRMIYINASVSPFVFDQQSARDAIRPTCVRKFCIVSRGSFRWAGWRYQYRGTCRECTSLG